MAIKVGDLFIDFEFNRFYLIIGFTKLKLLDIKSKMENVHYLVFINEYDKNITELKEDEFIYGVLKMNEIEGIIRHGWWVKELNYDGIKEK